MTKIVIIILNYNGWEDTIECLDSLKHAVLDSVYDTRVLIVDNGSTNNSINEINKWMSLSNIKCKTITDINMHYEDEKIILLSLKNNYGFAGGCNRGITFSLNNNFADHVLLLNNDTTVEPDFIHPLVEIIDKDPSIGIISPEIHDYYDRDSFILGGNISYKKCSGYHNYNNRSLNLKNVSFLSGCSWLIRKDAIENCGLLDENYFMYVEDVDYCYRMITAGYKLTCTRESVIYHKEGKSTKNKPIISYYNTRNRLYFSKKIKNHNLDKLIFYIYFFTTRIIKSVVQFYNAKYIYRGYLDFLKGKMGKYEEE